jgi:group I intron endonuclease
MSSYGVYWIRCADHTDVTTQGYVGVSINVERRLSEHQKSKQNPHLYSAIKKYGWDNLIKTPLLISTEEYCLEIERKLRPQECIGWNVIVGGGLPPIQYGNKSRAGKSAWNKGLPWSDEMKKTFSDAHLGQVPWNAGKKTGIAPPNKGVSPSAETRAKISVAKKGKKLSPETCAKMSAARLGKSPYIMTDEVKAKISASLKGNIPWNKRVNKES